MRTFNQLSDNIIQASTNVMILGILMAALGVASLASPETAGNITAGAIGAFLFLGGVLRLFAAAVSTSWKTLAVTVFYGLIMAAAGVWAMANPEMSLQALTVLVASYLVIDGIAQIYYCFKLRPIGGGYYLLINGLISLGLGALVFAKFPESSYYFVGLYLGLKLLLDGSIMTYVAARISKMVESYQEEYDELMA